MYQVDSTIPIPMIAERTKQRGGTPKYPFGSMKVGDSFQVAKECAKQMKAAASMYGLRNGVKFSTRKLPDGGARCWRTE